MTVPGGDASATEELIGLPGSLLAPTQCQQLAAGGAFRRDRSSPAGDLRLRIKADGFVLPKSPATGLRRGAAPGQGQDAP